MGKVPSGMQDTNQRPRGRSLKKRGPHTGMPARAADKRVHIKFQTSCRGKMSAFPRLRVGYMVSLLWPAPRQTKEIRTARRPAPRDVPRFDVAPAEPPPNNREGNNKTDDIARPDPRKQLRYLL